MPINVNLLENNKLDPNFIINILDKFENSFINLHIDYDEKDKNLLKKIKFCSEVIKLTSKISSNGYDNFRLGVSCNVKKNSPFFPYSFNGANNLSYSIAIENIGSFYKIVKNSNKNYFSLENLFIKKLSNHLINLNKIFINLGKKIR